MLHFIQLYFIKLNQSKRFYDKLSKSTIFTNNMLILQCVKQKWQKEAYVSCYQQDYTQNPYHKRIFLNNQTLGHAFAIIAYSWRVQVCQISYLFIFSYNILNEVCRLLLTWRRHKRNRQFNKLLITWFSSDLFVFKPTNGFSKNLVFSCQNLFFVTLLVIFIFSQNFDFYLLFYNNLINLQSYFSNIVMHRSSSVQKIELIQLILYYCGLFIKNDFFENLTNQIIISQVNDFNKEALICIKPMKSMVFGRANFADDGFSQCMQRNERSNLKFNSMMRLIKHIINHFGWDDNKDLYLSFQIVQTQSQIYEFIIKPKIYSKFVQIKYAYLFKLLKAQIKLKWKLKQQQKQSEIKLNSQVVFKPIDD